MPQCLGEGVQAMSRLSIEYPDICLKTFINIMHKLFGQTTYTVHTMPHVALSRVVPIPLNYMTANINCPHIALSHPVTTTTELHGC